MKTLFILFVILFSASSFALDAGKIDQLLKAKNQNLKALEMQGSRVIFGEVTGHFMKTPYNKVQVIITDHEAFLKEEVESVVFNGLQIMENVEVIRVKGQYITKEDIKAVIAQ